MRSWRTERGIPGFLGWLVAGLLACAPQAHGALRIVPAPAPLAPADVKATQRLIDAAMAALPPALKAGLDRELSLRWRVDLPAGVHGHARGRAIALDRVLLDGWARDAAAGDAPPHAALSALLHEVAHVYDRTQARLSADPRLRDLAGWQPTPLRLGLRGRRNDFRDRSPDLYELHSPAEFVAVNMEHFLLDPEYACRRPALHRHFAAHFGWSPPAAACPAALPYVTVGGEDGVAALLRLDPARVQAVDYLLAEGDERAMSRWGHVMLRLVVCAPGRAPGADCRLDLAHHRVLSFRAFVDDVQVSSWRGLTGAYPSRLFVLPLEQVIDEYTKVELRALQSIPLRLDPEEIAALLQQAARMHWEYDGRYFFISNNCAVETWKLLAAGVPRLGGTALRSITPTGLLRRLQRAGVADASVLSDRARAVRDGHLFASLRTYFDEMFAIADASLALPVADAGEWFALSPDARAPWLERAGLRAAAALFLLEGAALRRDELLARDELKRIGFSKRRGQGADMLRVEAALRALLEDAAIAGRPAGLLDDGGYGLPQAPELVRLAPLVAARGQRMAGMRTAMLEDARALLPAQRRQRLAGAGDNLRRLGERMRALRGEAESAAW